MRAPCAAAAAARPVRPAPVAPTRRRRAPQRRRRPGRGDDRAGARHGQGRSEPRHREDRSGRCAGDVRADPNRDRARSLSWPAWLAGSADCSAGSRNPRACSSGASSAARWRCLVVYLVAAAPGARVAQTGDGAFVAPTHVQDLDIRPESCRPTSARRRARCGTAASTAPRWRCSTAACCRGSRMCTKCRFAIRAPRATASRSRRASSKPGGRDYALAPDRTWQRAIYGGVSVDSRRRARARATNSTPRSPPRRSAETGARGRCRMTRMPSASRCSSCVVVAASSAGSRATRHWRHQGADAAEGRGAHNPFYAAQRFAEPLGARTSWERVFTAPAADAVIVLSGLALVTEPTRREALRALGRSRRAPGRGRFADRRRRAEFEQLVGDRPRTSRADDRRRDELNENDRESSCRHVPGGRSVDPDPRSTEQRAATGCCDVDRAVVPHARNSTPTLGASRDAQAIQPCAPRSAAAASRSSTRSPFRYRDFLDGDQPRLFVAATQLRRGDDVAVPHRGRPRVAAGLIWRFGAPAVLLLLAAVALGTVARAVRFGPLVGAAANRAPFAGRADSRHRAVRAALRRRRGAARRRACARCDDAAIRRIAGYDTLSPPNERAAALAHVTGFDGATISRRPLTMPARDKPASCAARSRCSKPPDVARSD